MHVEQHLRSASQPFPRVGKSKSERRPIAGVGIDHAAVGGQSLPVPPHAAREKGRSVMLVQQPRLVRCSRAGGSINKRDRQSAKCRPSLGTLADSHHVGRGTIRK